MKFLQTQQLTNDQLCKWDWGLSQLATTKLLIFLPVYCIWRIWHVYVNIIFFSFHKAVCSDGMLAAKTHCGHKIADMPIQQHHNNCGTILSTCCWGFLLLFSKGCQLRRSPGRIPAHTGNTTWSHTASKCGLTSRASSVDLGPALPEVYMWEASVKARACFSELLAPAYRLSLLILPTLSAIYLLILYQLEGDLPQASWTYSPSYSPMWRLCSSIYAA